MSCPLSIIFLLLIALRTRKLGDKLFCYFSIWCIGILIDLELSQRVFGEISERFDLFFLLFLIILYSSYVISSKFFNKSREITIKVPANIKFEMYYKICIIFSLFNLVWGLINIRTMSFGDLRQIVAQGDISFHSGISTALLASAMYYANTYNYKWEIKARIAVTMLGVAVLSTSKMFLVIDTLYILPWYIRDYRIKIKNILVLIFGSIVGFYLFNGMTGRLAGGTDSVFRNLLYTMNGYLIGGLAIFQRYLDNNIYYTSPGWIKTGRWVGNVSTAFVYLYQNYNIILFIIKVILIGILYALLNMNIKSIKFLRIYSLYPLFFIFFDELYFKSITQWIVFCIAGFLLLFIKPNQADAGYDDRRLMKSYD